MTSALLWKLGRPLVQWSKHSIVQTAVRGSRFRSCLCTRHLFPKPAAEHCLVVPGYPPHTHTSTNWILPVEKSSYPQQPGVRRIRWRKEKQNPKQTSNSREIKKKKKTLTEDFLSKTSDVIVALKVDQHNPHMPCRVKAIPGHVIASLVVRALPRAITLGLHKVDIKTNMTRQAKPWRTLHRH